MLSACAPAPREPSATGAGTPATSTRASGPLPTYFPFTSGPKPDYRSADTRLVDAFEQNPTWHEVNRRLSADVRMNIIPATDWRTKFATTMAGGDLPDIIHVYFGLRWTPNTVPFIKTNAADLTP